MLAVRVVVVTILVTLLAFAVSLLLGILGIALTNVLRDVDVSMAIAYRNVALPFAGAVLIISFSAILTREIREFRRERAATREYSQAA